MNRQTYELIEDQVRDIFRALTGGELPQTPQPVPLPPGVDPQQAAWERFATLEMVARALLPVAERLRPPPFCPPIDVLEDGGEVLIELLVPGVAVDDVRIDLGGGMLVIWGDRAVRSVNGHIYRHSEIPRGPFRRVLALPPGFDGKPRVEVDNGIVRVRIPRRAGKAQA